MVHGHKKHPSSFFSKRKINHSVKRIVILKVNESK